MKYTTLGKSGLTVSRIALGCMSYGSSKWRAWVFDYPEAAPFFKAALDGGVTFFDTANMYSNGASEEVTGRALGEMAARDKVVIATKVFYAVAGDTPQTQGLTRPQILKACDDSLRRLRTDYIDLYQIHRWDPHTPLDETLEALHSLVAAGKVRHIGASSGWAWRMMKALSISERNGWAKFASMQNHYNALYREEEREMMPLCISEGVGVIPWSPLARGLLTRPRPATGSVKTADSARSAIDAYSVELYEGNAQWAIVDAVEAVAKQRGVPMAEVGLAWLLAKPGVTAPIIGATKLSHLESAIAGVDVTLSPEEIASIDAPYAPQSVKGHDD
jgi:aryl-alcohol dehydrogenase-like predicted oxidoreductase